MFPAGASSFSDITLSTIPDEPGAVVWDDTRFDGNKQADSELFLPGVARLLRFAVGQKVERSKRARHRSLPLRGTSFSVSRRYDAARRAESNTARAVSLAPTAQRNLVAVFEKRAPLAVGQRDRAFAIPG